MLFTYTNKIVSGSNLCGGISMSTLRPLKAETWEQKPSQSAASSELLGNQQLLQLCSWSDIQVGFSRILEGIILIEVAGTSGTLFFSQSNADVSLVCTHICWVLAMTALPVERIYGISRHSDIVHQLVTRCWGFFKDGIAILFYLFYLSLCLVASWVVEIQLCS